MELEPTFNDYGIDVTYTPSDKKSKRDASITFRKMEGVFDAEATVGMSFAAEPDEDSGSDNEVVIQEETI